jgi:hypothetical protein
MEKEFVIYQQALELKELGFDESCFAFWEAEFSKPIKQLGKLDNNGNLLREKTYSAIITDYPEYVLAPLKQQVFRWFRENKMLLSLIFQDENMFFWYEIESGIYQECTSKGFDTYEEAESACIDRLIEIIKNK